MARCDGLKIAPSGICVHESVGRYKSLRFGTGDVPVTARSVLCLKFLQEEPNNLRTACIISRYSESKYTKRFFSLPKPILKIAPKL